jgi:hypothetical protein
MPELGLPQIIIDFKTKSVSAIQRSARGIVVMLLKNENTNTSKFYKIVDTTDVPETELTDRNVDLVKKCLLGTPAKVLLYTLPLDSVTIPEPAEGEEAEARVTQATILKQLKVVKWNYICHPTATTQEMTDLSTWIKTQRNTYRKTFKAVLSNTPADDKGIINLTTGNIRVVNPEYTDALNLAGGDETQVPNTIQKYLVYTAAEYTARIAGILAGLALDRSATYYELPEVVDCDTYDDIDAAIDDGELCLFDEFDGNGVKIARACNSLHTFTTDVGEDFRFIKIVEAVDMITDDIRDTFKNRYVGKIINDYNHKMLFISAILVYFRGLKGNVLDNSETAVNTVDIDEAAQVDYITLKGLDDPSTLSVQQIREYNTGTKVMLAGRVTPVNAMEDLKIDFVM